MSYKGPSIAVAYTTSNDERQELCVCVCVCVGVTARPESLHLERSPNGGDPRLGRPR